MSIVRRPPDKNTAKGCWKLANGYLQEAGRYIDRKDYRSAGDSLAYAAETIKNLRKQVRQLSK